MGKYTIIVVVSVSITLITAAGLLSYFLIFNKSNEKRVCHREIRYNDVSKDNDKYLVGEIPFESKNDNGDQVLVIPIAPAKGVNNMEPQLALEYRSSLSFLNSEVGVSWTLTGMSEISRCYRTMAHDKKFDNIKFTYDDAFCLDGQRLILVAGKYGAEGSEYRQELDGQNRIRAFEKQGNGPKYFIVNTKDNKILTYNSMNFVTKDNVTTTMRWFLSKVEDYSGNSIKYVYTVLENYIYLTRVDYANKQIVLEYESRSDTQKSYYKHYLVGNLNKRLKSILVRTVEDSSNLLSRRYVITYRTYGPGSLSLVSSVQVCFSDKCLRPLEFDYSNLNAVLKFNEKKVIQHNNVCGPKTTKECNVRQAIDMNGDGLTDLVGFGDDGVYVSINRGLGQFDPAVLWTSSFSKNSGDWNIQDHIRLAADVNGDRLPDIVGFYNDGVYVALNQNGVKLDAMKIWLSGEFGRRTSINWYIDYDPRILSDMNNDGLVDIVGFHGNHGLLKSLNDGTKFVPAKLYSNKYKSTHPLPFNSIDDIDGDSLVDFILTDYRYSPNSFYSNTTGGYTEIKIGPRIANRTWDESGWNMRHFRMFADLNRDNLPDLIGIYDKSVVVGQNEPVRENTFKIEKIGEMVLSSKVSSNFKYRQLADMNGDGILDIVLFNCDGIHVSLGKGDGGFSSVAIWSNLIISMPCSAGIFDYKNSWIAQDIDGDDMPDAIAFENSGTTLKALLNQNGRLFLKSVTDSLGNHIDYFYDTFQNKTVYNDDDKSEASSEYTKYNVNRHVVSRVVSKMNNCPNNADGTSSLTQSIEYKYGTYECNKVFGRNGCKFKWIETLDLVENKRKRIEFHTRFPLSGQIRAEASYDSLKKLIEKKSNTYRTYTKMSSFDKLPIYHILLNETRIDNYDNDKSNSFLFTKTLTNQYDDYDNLQRKLEKTVMGSSTLSEETILTLVNDQVNWIIGQVKEEKIVYISTSSSKTVQTNFAYDKVTRLVVSKVTHPNEANLAVEELYRYDSWGNVVNLKRREISSGKERTDKFTYSKNGVNQIIHYNPLNHIENYEYDLMDRLVTVIDSNNLTIKSEYDKIGNKIKEKSKDGSVKRWAYYWDFSLYNSVYRIEQEQLTNPAKNEFTLIEMNYHDSLKRKIRTVTKGFSGENIIEEYHFNKDHLLNKVSLKYKESVEKPIYVYIEYDSRKREIVRQEPRSEKGDYIKTITDYSGLKSTKQDMLGYVRIEERNLQGKIVRVEDSVGSVATYKYDALGNVLQIIDSHKSITNMDYDLNGNQIKIEEPSFGTIQFEYNAFDEMTTKRDSNRNIFTYEYDALGRLVKRVESEGQTEWVYDKSLNGIGQLSFIRFKPSTLSVSLGSYNISYSYDSYSREIEETRNIIDANGKVETLTVRKTYDEFSRLKSQTYPKDNFKAYLCYNTYGYLIGISNSDASCKSYIWKPSEFSAAGHVLKESFANNNIQQEYKYDRASYLTNRIEARDIFNRVLRRVELEYDNRKNLAKRVDYGLDAKFSSMNTFTYDRLDRIISSNSYKTLTQLETSKSFTYDSMGNIISYNGRIYQYDSARPKRATKIGNSDIGYDSMGNVKSSSDYQIEWYSYLKAKLIRNTTTGSQIEFRYGHDYSRTMKIVRNSNKTEELVTHYFGDMYEKTISKSEIVHKYYLVINEKILTSHIVTEKRDTNKTEKATFYMLTDNAGSVDAVLDQNAAVLVSYKYEAFGERRVSYSNTSMSKYLSMLNRGYTGHEHIDESRLINMNGRIFDSLFLRFLSPDLNVQDIYNLQNLNRYIYCLNNPFKYKDPSGYFFKKLFKTLFVVAIGILTVGQMMPFAAALTAGIQIGALKSAAYFAILGASSGFTTTFVSTGGNFKASLKGALSGGISGGISGGLQYFTHLSNPGLFNLRKFSMETVTNGLVNKANDRDFFDGIHTHIFSYVANEFYMDFSDYLNPDGAEIIHGAPVAEKNYYDKPDPKKNNFGTQGQVSKGGVIGDKSAKVSYTQDTLPPGNQLHEGSTFSIYMEKYGPGMNAIAFFHDMILYKFPSIRETFIGNYGTMPVAALLTYSAQYNQIQCSYCFNKDQKKR